MMFIYTSLMSFSSLHLFIPTSRSHDLRICHFWSWYLRIRYFWLELGHPVSPTRVYTYCSIFYIFTHTTQRQLEAKLVKKLHLTWIVERCTSIKWTDWIMITKTKDYIMIFKSYIMIHENGKYSMYMRLFWYSHVHQELYTVNLG